MNEQNSWSALLQGIVSAALSGAATTTATAIAVPELQEKPGRLAAVAGVGALVGVANLFKQAPAKKTKAKK
jgi:Zn-dependent alcohol dehydrogenase